MSEKRFEDDGVEYNNNYNYALLDTYYEFDGKRIIEWNKHSSNAEYTNLERIAEILNIKQMRLESLMKHREEVGKLFDRIEEQQAIIRKLQDLCGESDSENAKLRIEIKKLKEEEKLYAQEILRLNELLKQYQANQDLGGGY